MATKDLARCIGAIVALATVSVADDTPQNGAIIDTQGFESLTVAVQSGALTDADATFAVKLQHGNEADGSDLADVAADDLLGAAPAFTFADDNVVKRVGYRGTKRYVRVVVTPANNLAAAQFSAVAVLGHPRELPVA